MWRGRGWWWGPWPGHGPFSYLPPWLRPGWWFGRGWCWWFYPYLMGYPYYSPWLYPYVPPSPVGMYSYPPTYPYTQPPKSEVK